MGRALILAPNDLADDALHAVGGKATGLLAVQRAGLRVPAWRVLPFGTVAARAWKHDPALRDALADLLAALGGQVAVRSSARGEDGRETSHAGQYHTAFASTPGDLIRALDAVADSAHGADMAIVLQAALAPDWAGVAFSARPSAARDDQFYVEAVRGHGQQLVDGTTTPMALALALDGTLDGVPELVPHGTALADALFALEDQLDAAVDLEWAIADDTLHLLQARPLTALAGDPTVRPQTCHTSWFFDQRFLEPISPFTRSTLIPLIVRASIGEALAMRGEADTSVAVLFYGGQAYLSHDAFARMLRGAPWWFLSPDLRQLFPRHNASTAARSVGLRDMFAYACDALRAVWRHRCDVFGNVGAWSRFRDALPAAIEDALRRGDLATQWTALDALSLRFLALHRWSILWADYAFRAYTLFARVIGTPRADAALRHGMHLPTAEANAALAWARAEGSPAAWADLCARYGHRSASLDYATPTWAEIYAQPSAPVAPLAPHSTAKPRGLAGLLAPVRRLLEMREEQRFAWEHILAAQRILVLTHAQAWHTQGKLARAEDVWLCSWDEVVAATLGAALPARHELAVRHHALRVERLLPRPLFLAPEDAPTPGIAAPGTLLQGLGASAGQARGTAIHLRHPGRAVPADFPKPCILIVPSLDPAHTHLLRAAAGIVAERGGLLSHAAILAREYRVPMVTACEGALARVPHGAQVQIDGQRGTVLLGSEADPG